MDELIKQALVVCGFSECQESIDVLRECAILHMVDSANELIYLELQDWIYTIGICEPDHLLPEYMYFLKEIDDFVISRIHNSLAKKNLRATAREIHELAFQAIEINENLDKIKDIIHAINYVIVIFKSGGWETPCGFEDFFLLYKTKLPKLTMQKKEELTC